MGLNNPFDFTDRRVVLAGAVGGLGVPIVRAFAEAGADVALCDINEEALARLGDEIQRFGGRVVTAKVNLCAQREVEDFVRLVRDKFHQIDVLVNLVGGIIRKPSIDYPIEDWERIIDINLKACWLCCQAVGRVMIEQRNGRIINFSSNAGLHGVPGYPAYSPAKAGVIALTRVLAVEWGPFGVRANVLSPGFTKTPFNAEVLSDADRVQRILMRMPLGQVLPDDALVGPTLFLASDAARWINGHTLNVDSGYNIT
jgi:2-deoxy-D-gluconate 3-dehydrogenase